MNIGQGRYEYYSIENPLTLALPSMEFSQILLENGAETFSKDRYGSIRGLIGAAVMKCNPDIEMIKLYLDYGADINLGDYGETPLLISLFRNKTADVSKFLISNGADVNILDNNGSSALMRAIFMGHLDVAELLIEMEETDTEIVDSDGDTALTIAAKLYRYDLVDMLTSKVYTVSKVEVW